MFFGKYAPSASELYHHIGRVVEFEGKEYILLGVRKNYDKNAPDWAKVTYSCFIAPFGVNIVTIVNPSDIKLKNKGYLDLLKQEKERECLAEIENRKFEQVGI